MKTIEIDLNGAVDYLKFRDNKLQAFTALGGWPSLNDSQKMEFIEHSLNDPAFDYATNNANKIAFLVSQGETVESASDLLVDFYAQFHLREIASCTKRMNSLALYKLIFKTLSVPAAADFYDSTEKLARMFCDQAIKGTQYGLGGKDGLMDFIESTGSFSAAGLAQKGYELNTGTINDFIAALKDILINGNYSM